MLTKPVAALLVVQPRIDLQGEAVTGARAFDTRSKARLLTRTSVHPRTYGSLVESHCVRLSTRQARLDKEHVVIDQVMPVPDVGPVGGKLLSISQIAHRLQDHVASQPRQDREHIDRCSGIIAG